MGDFMFMSKEEIAVLTDKKQRKKQLDALINKGIKFEISPKGNILVSKNYMEKLLGFDGKTVKERKITEPNYDAFKARRERKYGKTTQR